MSFRTIVGFCLLGGYARVSKADQNLDFQKDSLERAGCEKIFTDVLSGSETERPGLSQARNYVRAGVVLVVWKLDRLGRALSHLLRALKGLRDRQIGFQTLTEAMDTTMAGGRLVFQFFGAIAESEQSLILERIQSGLAAARYSGLRILDSMTCESVAKS